MSVFDGFFVTTFFCCNSVTMVLFSILFLYFFQAQYTRASINTMTHKIVISVLLSSESSNLDCGILACIDVALLFLLLLIVWITGSYGLDSSSLYWSLSSEPIFSIISIRVSSTAHASSLLESPFYSCSCCSFFAWSRLLLNEPILPDYRLGSRISLFF